MASDTEPIQLSVAIWGIVCLWKNACASQRRLVLVRGRAVWSASVRSEAILERKRQERREWLEFKRQFMRENREMFRLARLMR